MRCSRVPRASRSSISVGDRARACSSEALNFLSDVELGALWSGIWRPRQGQFDLVSLVPRFVRRHRHRDARRHAARSRRGDLPLRVRAPARSPDAEADPRDPRRDPERRDRLLRAHRDQPDRRAGPLRRDELVHDDGRRDRRRAPHDPADRVGGRGRDVRRAACPAGSGLRDRRAATDGHAPRGLPGGDLGDRRGADPRDLASARRDDGGRDRRRRDRERQPHHQPVGAEPDADRGDRLARDRVRPGQDGGDRVSTRSRCCTSWV